MGCFFVGVVVVTKIMIVAILSSCYVCCCCCCCCFNRSVQRLGVEVDVSATLGANDIPGWFEVVNAIIAAWKT